MKRYHTWAETQDEAEDIAEALSRGGETVFIFCNEDNDAFEIMNEAEVDASMPNMAYMLCCFTNGERD